MIGHFDWRTVANKHAKHKADGFRHAWGCEDAFGKVLEEFAVKRGTWSPQDTRPRCNLGALNVPTSPTARGGCAPMGEPPSYPKSMPAFSSTAICLSCLPLPAFAFLLFLREHPSLSLSISLAALLFPRCPMPLALSLPSNTPSIAPACVFAITCDCVTVLRET